MLRLDTPSDFDTLYDIYMDKSINPYLSFEVLSKEEFRPIFNELIHDARLFIYEINKAVAATCIIRRLKRRCHHGAVLGTLATHPNLQGQGIGTRLVKEVLDLLKSEGLKRVELSYEADNPGARKFYERLGFQEEGVLKNWFKRKNEDHAIDEIIMAIAL
jgi:RimJ/RimL family protein N-acetyltransferase